MKPILLISLLLVFLSGCGDNTRSKLETGISGIEIKEVEFSISGESFGELIFELPDGIMEGEWTNVALSNESSELVSINAGEKLYAVKNMSDSGVLSVSFDVDDSANNIIYRYKLMITDSSVERLENIETLQYRMGQCSYEFS